MNHAQPMAVRLIKQKVLYQIKDTFRLSSTGQVAEHTILFVESQNWIKSCILIGEVFSIVIRAI